MPDFYYFISSLPMLRFGAKPPFTFSEYVERCHERLGESTARVISSATVTPPRIAPARLPDVLGTWYAFETEARNAAMRIRARRQKTSRRHDWLRPSAMDEPWIEKSMEKILSLESAFEQEQAHQKLRWQFLDDLALTHHFDMACAIIYGLKLQILETLNGYDREKGRAAFDENLKETAHLALETRTISDLNT